ncbi:MAG: riboflavin biosynthesis protein RibF [Planctomycetes bacterium]|nr:riboflavin biosynthesis protein RibF [Planctomycetota bacterium]
MKVVEGLEHLDRLDLLGRHGPAAIEARSAVIVGVFDGVHLGHQRLLHELLEMASALRALPTVVTFRNHPDEVLRGRRVDWIASLPLRLRLLRRAGVGRAVLLDFDDRLRTLSARAFSERILLHGLRCTGLLLGYDSAIGRDREGTPQRMAELGRELGFEVRQGSRFEVDGRPVSSTAIRDAIRRGDLDAAHRMLGRWPAAFGSVVHGDERGRTLGFPTANVVPQSLVLPPEGVYAVTVILAGTPLPGVANLGRRPTFASDPDTAPLLEVHLLDFTGDLYSQELEVAFVARLRPEQRFADPAALRAQIALDIAAARRALDDDTNGATPRDA